MVLILIPCMFLAPVCALVAWHRPLWYTFLYNFVRQRVTVVTDWFRWLHDPSLYAKVHSCMERPNSTHAVIPKGIVVFFHGIHAGWWQWRNVANEFMDDPILKDYAYYVPNLVDKGNVESRDAAMIVAHKIAEYVALLHDVDYDPVDLIFVSTSLGGRIAFVTECMLGTQSKLIPEGRIKTFVHVAISPLLAPLPLAKMADALGVLQYIPFHDSLLSAVVYEHMHTDIIDAWKYNRAKRDHQKEHYMIIGSEHDELIPITSAMPARVTKVKGLTTHTHIVSNGSDHAGIVQIMSTWYKDWIKARLTETIQ